MEYNQNRKIEQVLESTLIIGADIAKKNHVARAQDFRGIEFDKALTFKNSEKGFSKVLNWIHKLMTKHEKTQVIFGVEPTGQYWLPLAQQNCVWE